MPVKTLLRISVLLIALFTMLYSVDAQINPADFQYNLSVSGDLKAPLRIAIDYNDQVYVVDTYRHRICKYDQNGNFLTEYSPCSNPVSIAINALNEVFVGDGTTGQILKMNPNASFSVFSSLSRFPNSMVFSPDNHLFISDSKLKAVLKLDPTGALVQTMGAGTLGFPTGIAYDAENDRIIVGEHGAIQDQLQTRVYLFNADGTLFTMTGMYGNANGQLYRVQGITVGRCNNIYVCEPYQGTISVFSDNGQFITRFGQYGNAPGQLNVPMDVAFDSQNRIWLASMNNNSLEVFTIQDETPSATISSDVFATCEGEQVMIPVYLSGIAPWTLEVAHNGTAFQTYQNITTNPFLIETGLEGKYTLTAVSDATQNGTCLSGKAMVELIPAPTAGIPNNNLILCEGQSATIPVTFTGNAPWTFEYSDGSATQSVQTSVNPYNLFVSASGNYTLTSLQDVHCSGSQLSGMTTITVIPRPESDFTWTKQNLKVNFFNNSQNAQDYLWDFGDNSFSNAISPVHTYPASGIYTVTLFAMSHGCLAKTKIQQISVSTTRDTAAIMNPETEKSAIAAFVEDSNEPELFPNPSSGLLTLRCAKNAILPSHLELADARGMRVEQWNTLPFSQTGEPSMLLDLTRLPAGIYTLTCKFPDSSKNLKLVISK